MEGNMVPLHPRRLLRYRLPLTLAAALLLGIASVDSLTSDVAQQSPQQSHDSHGQAATASGNVAADRVQIGPEFFARRTDLANTLIVPAKQTVELAEDASYDYIEVAGTLKVSRAHDTTTRFTTM